MSKSMGVEAHHLTGDGSTDSADDGFTCFCNRLGIELNTRSTGPKPIEPSIFQDVLTKRTEYQIFYVLLLTVAVFAVIAQIALGIVISSLSGIDAARFKIAIIILGAINSFIGFLSGWIQYQGQPARSGQFYSALDNVRTEILASHGELKNKGTMEEGDDDAARIRDLYKQAVADALANQTTVWSSGGKMPDLRGQPSSALTPALRDRTDNLFDGNVKHPNHPRRKGGAPFTPRTTGRNAGGPREVDTDDADTQTHIAEVESASA